MLCVNFVLIFLGQFFVSLLSFFLCGMVRCCMRAGIVSCRFRFARQRVGQATGALFAAQAHIFLLPTDAFARAIAGTTSPFVRMGEIFLPARAVRTDALGYVPC